MFWKMMWVVDFVILKRFLMVKNVYLCVSLYRYKVNWVVGGVGWGFMWVGFFMIRFLILFRINLKVFWDIFNFFLKDFLF